jgi:hypothetical protein
VAAAAAAATAKRKAALAVLPPAGQVPGEAMTHYTSKFLGLPGPSLIVVLATLAFLAVLAVPPTVALARRRQPGGKGERTNA